jgi:hypothetical protein
MRVIQQARVGRRRVGTRRVMYEVLLVRHAMTRTRHPAACLALHGGGEGVGLKHTSCLTKTETSTYTSGVPPCTPLHPRLLPTWC